MVQKVQLIQEYYPKKQRLDYPIIGYYLAKPI